MQGTPDKNGFYVSDLDYCAFVVCRASRLEDGFLARHDSYVNLFTVTFLSNSVSRFTSFRFLSYLVYTRT